NDESNETENQMNDESNETENQMNDESNETENQMNDESNLPGSPEVSDSMNNISLKKELDEIVQGFKEKKILPDVVAELIQKKKLNTMILDLYDYDKGYEISFNKFEDDVEIFHGQYSYGVSLIEYIRDGEIPYEIFDNLCRYDFKLYYDGYVVCRLRIHFEQESMRSHFVLLKHTIQTINGECAMNCKADDSLDFETERARLINHYSPDLCLDPNPVVAEIVISNELNQHPFITPYLKHIIQTEKARREKGVKGMSKTSANYSEPAPTKPKDDNDWNFRLDNLTAEEAETAKFASNMKPKPSIVPYLKERQICFPDKDSFTGFHVEIENFVYEYDGRTRAGNVESIQDKLCIGVRDDKEFYYGAYKLDERMKDYVTYYWWPIGGRELLDIHVNAVTKAELKLCCGGMKITHNRMFDERVDFSGGEMKIVRHKLENP
ncbi:hypothetical protein AVEN_45433-1, partial [Araneus ventricosus]